MLARMHPQKYSAPAVTAAEALETGNPAKESQHNHHSTADHAGLDDMRLALQTALDALPKTPLEKSQIAWLAAIAYRDELAGKKPGRRPKNSPLVGYSRAEIAKHLGISESLLDEAITVEREVKDGAIREKIAAGITDVGRVYDHVSRPLRDREILDRVKALAEVEGRYQIIVADPMWEYDNDGVSGAAAGHYPTSNDAILGLADDVRAKSADDCVLLMWAVSPQIPFAYDVVREWGFEYKQTCVWHKTGRMGMGSIFRIDTEFVVVATRGKGVPTVRRDVRNIFDAPVGKHSEKPACFYDTVKSMWPTASKLELFARAQRPGWTTWGAEAPSVSMETEAA